MAKLSKEDRRFKVEDGLGSIQAQLQQVDRNLLRVALMQGISPEMQRHTVVMLEDVIRRVKLLPDRKK